MRIFFVRARRMLLLAAALAVAAALAGGTTAHAATAAGSGTPCSLNPAASCQSTDGTVALNIDYSDASACTFAWHVEWGDGSVSDVTVTDPADGYVLLAQHTYANANTYTISATGQVTAGDCETSPFTGHFTLLKPTPVPGVPGKACVFNAPSGGISFSLPDHKHLFVSGHVGWAYLSDPATGTWEYGANEGPEYGIYELPSLTWIRSGTWADAISIFKNALGAPGKSKDYYHSGNYYKSYRCATVPVYHSTAALDTAKALGGVLYEIPYFDCLAQATDVLAIYGAPVNDVTYLLNPDYWVPNNYYHSVYMSKFGPVHKI